MKKSITAGILIALASLVYLSVDSVLGAFIFSFGLLAICVLELDLYTGKIGFCTTESDKNAWYYIKMLLGNIIGVLLICGLIKVANYNPTHLDTSFTYPIGNKALDLYQIKSSYNVLQLTIKGMLCGMLMTIAVSMWKKTKGSLSGILGVISCVAVFILSGYEHCIADFSYLFLLPLDKMVNYLYIPIFVIIGNTLGSILFTTILTFENGYFERTNMRYTQRNTEILKAGKLTNYPYIPEENILNPYIKSNNIVNDTKENEEEHKYEPKEVFSDLDCLTEDNQKEEIKKEQPDSETAQED